MIEKDIPESLEIHAWILQEHSKDIEMLRDRTHDLKSDFDGLSINVKIIQESLKDIKGFQQNITDKLDKISDSIENLEAIKKVITTSKFWVFVGWVTFVGLIVIVDHLQHFQKLLGFI